MAIHLKVTGKDGKTTTKNIGLTAYRNVRGSGVKPKWYTDAKSVYFWSGFGPAGVAVPGTGDSWVKIK
jgi:hypothetical protein